jgi:hypothetical protein
MEAKNNSLTLWGESASRCKYAVHNGAPMIGVSGDTGDGFIVPVPAPTWFAAIEDEGTRDNVFRALSSHALRVGQAKLKAAEKPTREVALAGVASALNGGYKPGRETVNDIVESETATRFATHIRGLVLKAKPDATEKAIADTIGKQAAGDKGKALLAKIRGEVLASMTYTVSRKGKGEAGGAVELGDLM